MVRRDPGDDAISITAAWAIRPATPDDAEPLGALLEQLGYLTPREEVRRRLDRLDAAREVLVAVTGGTPVGFVAVAVGEHFVGGSRGEVQGLVVTDNWRRRGVASALLRAAEAWAFERGCSRMHLTSNVVREGAHAFYQGHGYRIVKTQRVFEKALIVEQ